MDFSLIETMRWEPVNGFVRLNLHLARLKASAQTLGFEGADQAEAVLNAYVEKELSSGLTSPRKAEMSALQTEGSERSPLKEAHFCIADGAHPPLSPLVTSPPQGGRSTSKSSSHRIRLEFFPDGKINITSAPFEIQSEDTIWKVKIASARLSSTNDLLRHKTSRRSVYDQARAEFAKDEADEVLLLNEKGELCEGSITSLFVDDGSGVLLTPPLSCGLLAGVLRTSLICAKKARVQKLTPRDLDNNTFYIGNSLRGLIEAKLEY